MNIDARVLTADQIGDLLNKCVASTTVFWRCFSPTSFCAGKGLLARYGMSSSLAETRSLKNDDDMSKDSPRALRFIRINSRFRWADLGRSHVPCSMIVATMQSKLNRKKAEQINIEEICMQVLQPQVPLALRLTGILMGGIVLIYDRKVRILHEDVNDFLCKIKTAIDSKARPDKHISLPRTKLHARFEHVTINYDFDTFEDIERAMLAPGTPGQEEGDADKEEYVVSAAPDPYARLSSSGDSRHLNGGGVSADVPTPLLNQVSNDDITLEERNVPDNLHQQYQDFGMDFPEDRIPPSDNMFMEDFFPEIQATVSISPDPLPQMPSPIHTANHLEKSADQSKQQGTDQPEFDESIPPREGEQLEELEPPELAQAAAAPENLGRRRVRGVATRKAIFDEAYMEIPASVYASWIHDTADIRERNNRPPVGKDLKASIIQRHLDLPSVCLLSPTCVQGLEPFWPPQLAQIWERTVTGKFAAPTEDDVMKDRREDPSVRPTTSVRVSTRTSDPSDQSLEIASVDNSFPGADGVNAEIAGDPTADSGDLNSVFPPADFASAARSRVFGPNELRDYGSVEKLRTALQSPSAGSDDFWGSLLGRTPGQQVNARPDRSRSTPGSGVSGSLPLDLERDPPTGDSGRCKRSRRSGSFRSTSPRIFDNLSPGLDGVGSNYDIFSQHKGSQAAIPSHFDLMEETQRDTPQESMKIQVSSTLLQYIKERLDNQEPWSRGFISLFELSEGLRRAEAAKLFYQICVLSSNHFLTVKQDVPYGDISLGRGIYL